MSQASRNLDSAATDANTPWITADQVLPLARLEGGKLPIRVAGRAKKLMPWKQFCYGVFEPYPGTELSFRIPVDEQPQDDAPIIIAGVLTVNRKMSVELQGRVEGPWLTAAREPVVPIPDRGRNPAAIGEFLGKNGLSGLGFLASKTGWDDICSAARLQKLRNNTLVMPNFGDETKFLEALKQLIGTGVKGLVIARGGGERLETIGDSRNVTRALIETGLPFYVALGHANDVLLLDKHADDVFLTPSDFGHRLRDCLDAAQEAEDARAEASDAEDKLIQLSTKLDRRESELDETRRHLNDLLQQSKLNGQGLKAELRQWRMFATTAGAGLFLLLLWLAMR
ncbi:MULTISPECIES: exodeoxyribonuclease VII large subunit [Xanthomonas]|uniref:Exodeoxyribonuclease VII large subunit n=2 Tax=Xanthomonas TaxID=338 RepID=A0AAW3U7G2_XANEU|nr:MULTISPECIES: exodeoxyribonuclease VII large subunit [Xanthomonas]KGR51718.1 hypothetical protein NX07_13140 [Xanthomonas vasicola]KGR52312.1 hypothetical protein NX09_17175 [Xanthomonas vasicola]MBB4724736.1 exodeoxyribonuclease VII large subunit [Xanthomonas euvesicatoria]MBB4871571.1 exodeoxyribonuclease VII large subunit [Xanthomonas euvesicatoria]